MRDVSSTRSLLTTLCKHIQQQMQGANETLFGNHPELLIKGVLLIPTTEFRMWSKLKTAFIRLININFIYMGRIISFLELLLIIIKNVKIIIVGYFVIMIIISVNLRKITRM
jgi:hypothetical protein